MTDKDNSKELSCQGLFTKRPGYFVGVTYSTAAVKHFVCLQSWGPTLPYDCYSSRWFIDLFSQGISKEEHKKNTETAKEVFGWRSCDRESWININIVL